MTNYQKTEASWALLSGVSVGMNLGMVLYWTIQNNAIGAIIHLIVVGMGLWAYWDLIRRIV